MLVLTKAAHYFYNGNASRVDWNCTQLSVQTSVHLNPRIYLTISMPNFQPHNSATIQQNRSLLELTERIIGGFPHLK